MGDETAECQHDVELSAELERPHVTQHSTAATLVRYDLVGRCKAIERPRATTDLVPHQVVSCASISPRDVSRPACETTSVWMRVRRTSRPGAGAR